MLPLEVRKQLHLYYFLSAPGRIFKSMYLSDNNKNLEQLRTKTFFPSCYIIEHGLVFKGIKKLHFAKYKLIGGVMKSAISNHKFHDRVFWGKLDLEMNGQESRGYIRPHLKSVNSQNLSCRNKYVNKRKVVIHYFTLTFKEPWTNHCYITSFQSTLVKQPWEMDSERLHLWFFSWKCAEDKLALNATSHWKDKQNHIALPARCRSLFLSGRGIYLLRSCSSLNNCRFPHTALLKCLHFLCF